MRDAEQIIQRILEISPTVKVRQLEVLHPGADDDGIWIFERPSNPCEVQIESSNGMCPFLIETDENDNRLMGNSVEETVRIVSGLLHLDTTMKSKRRVNEC